MIWEVLLIDFGVIPVRGGPSQISSGCKVQSIAKLVVQVDGDVTHHTGGHRTFASTQFKERGGAGFDRYRDINKFSRLNIVSDPHDMRTNSVWLENIGHDGAHAPVGRRVGNGLTRHHVTVLVDHVGRDGQGLICRDGGRQWSDDEFGWCTGCHRDVLMSADQTETRRDGDGPCRGWREETI